MGRPTDAGVWQFRDGCGDWLATGWTDYCWSGLRELEWRERGMPYRQRQEQEMADKGVPVDNL